MSRPLPPRPRGNRKTLIIGFDFGTHSTKVVVRERGRPDGRIAQFDGCTKGYPGFASPSVVRQIGDRLYFGSVAVNSYGGDLHQSLKVTLLTDSTLKLVDALDNAELVAAYLAWAFQQVRKSISEEEYANIFLNVGAPMSHVENKELKAKYLRIVQAAWTLTFQEGRQVENGAAVSEVAALLRPLMNAPVQGSEVRRFEVLPETMAPIVSLSLDPLMRETIYVIVDMGAATTEMSVFHAGKPGADQKVLCYKDLTIFKGALDMQAAESMATPSGNARLARIIDQIERKYRGIWKSAYAVDEALPLSKRRWKDVIVVLSGGGTRHSAVDSRLRRSNPIPKWPEYETSFAVDRHEPGTLSLAGGMDKSDASLFAVANGLAVERAKWPIVFLSQEMEMDPLTAPEPCEPKDDWGDSAHRPRWV